MIFPSVGIFCIYIIYCIYNSTKCFCDRLKVDGSPKIGLSNQSGWRERQSIGGGPRATGPGVRPTRGPCGRARGSPGQRGWVCLLEMNCWFKAVAVKWNLKRTGKTRSWPVLGTCRTGICIFWNFLLKICHNCNNHCHYIDSKCAFFLFSPMTRILFSQGW